MTAITRQSNANEPLKKAVFFDRDGTLNVDVVYLHEPSKLVWISGAIDAIRWANENAYLVVVVTNQSGVARGYYREEDIHILHEYMNNELKKEGAHIDAFYYCPHHPEGKLPAYRQKCSCRKPAGGMLLKAIEDYNIDPHQSLLIGDSDTDIAAAENAGIRGVKYIDGDISKLLKQSFNQL